MEDDEKQRLIKEAIENGRLVRCPDGSAVGASDMENWAKRRAKGQSGVHEKKKRKKPSKPKRGGRKTKRTSRHHARQSKKLSYWDRQMALAIGRDQDPNPC